MKAALLDTIRLELRTSLDQGLLGKRSGDFVEDFELLVIEVS